MTLAEYLAFMEQHPLPRIEGDLVLEGIRFDTSHYDEGSDILYIHVEDDRPRHQWFDETQEGHAVQFTLDDHVHDAILMSPRLHLERDGFVAVTVREGGVTDRIPRDVIEPLLVDMVWPDVPDHVWDD